MIKGPFFGSPGYTQTPNDSDLSLSTLSSDMCEVIQALYGETKPDVIVVGHR